MTYEEVKRKKERNDLTIAARMLGITLDSARTRFRRGKEDMVQTVAKIIKNREALISENQPVNS